MDPPAVRTTLWPRPSCILRETRPYHRYPDASAHRCSRTRRCRAPHVDGPAPIAEGAEPAATAPRNLRGPRPPYRNPRLSPRPTEGTTVAAADSTCPHPLFTSGGRQGGAGHADLRGFSGPTPQAAATGQQQGSHLPSLGTLSRRPSSGRETLPGTPPPPTRCGPRRCFSTRWRSSKRHQVSPPFPVATATAAVKGTLVWDCPGQLPHL